MRRTKMERCAEWILDVLEGAGGPVKVKEIVRMAKEAGFSQATTFRARKHLAEQVADTEGRNAPNNEWVLPD